LLVVLLVPVIDGIRLKESKSSSYLIYLFIRCNWSISIERQSPLQTIRAAQPCVCLVFTGAASLTWDSASAEPACETVA